MGTSGSRHVVEKKVKVVIVGAGYAGITLAVQLLDVSEVRLISPEEYFFHNAGSPRACVQPEFAKSIMIPLKDTFKESFIQAKAVGINKESNKVMLDSGDEIEYTHLILATGTTGPFPFRLCTDFPKLELQEGHRLYGGLVDQVEKDNRIACIGGGAVGVEVAGEVKGRYPNKTVTLIRSNKTLCSARLILKAQSNLQSCLRRKGIQLILEDRVTNLNDIKFTEYAQDQTIAMESGETVQADLVFKCIGATPATQPFQDSLGDAITAEGLLQVDEYFKVKGTKCIFAIGDITDIVEEKMVVTASAHANLLAKNIKALVSGKNMSPYKLGKFIMIVPVGKDAGVNQIFGLVFGNFVTSKLKGEELFVNKFWNMLKQTRPTA